MSSWASLLETCRHTPQSVTATRFALQQKLFGRFHRLDTRPRLVQAVAAIPKLWCPYLTHYRAGEHSQAIVIDQDRCVQHFRCVLPYAGGVLLNGTCGDGWELTESEQLQMVELTMDLMAEEPELRVPMLVGALRSSPGEASELMDATMDMLATKFGSVDNIYDSSPFVGFLVAPPKGATSQEEMADALAGALGKQVPVAVLQSPKLTDCTLSVNTVAELASSFANLTMFVDESGEDALARSQRFLDGVFMVRAAEHKYAQWLAECDPSGYNAIMPPSANAFPREFSELMQRFHDGDLGSAESISARLTELVEDVTEHAKTWEFGRVPDNAARLADHVFAFPVHSDRLPMAHGGKLGDHASVRKAWKVVKRVRRLESTGYMDEGFSPDEWATLYVGMP